MEEIGSLSVFDFLKNGDPILTYYPLFIFSMQIINTKTSYLGSFAKVNENDCTFKIMKIHFSLILFFLLSIKLQSQSIDSSQNTEYLFPITENEKFGYIDTKGKVVIKPQFEYGGDFSEGLAPVRKGALFGYIDIKGNFVIPVQFDIATTFQNGAAIVYKDKISFYIDKSGNKLFKGNFFNLQPFEKLYAQVCSRNWEKGLISKNGELLLDTVCSEIYPFSEGFAVVKKRYYGETISEKKLFSTESLTFGLIDTTGKQVVSFGKYVKIEDFKLGKAKAIRVLPDENNNAVFSEGYIDSNLNFFPSKVPLYPKIISEYSEGLSAVQILKSDKKREGFMDDTYCGYIDTKGRIVFSDTGISWAEKFSYNRALVRNGFSKWYCIDKKGNKIPNIEANQYIFRELDYFLCSDENGYSQIFDTNGRKILDHELLREYIHGTTVGGTGRIVNVTHEEWIFPDSKDPNFCNSEVKIIHHPDTYKYRKNKQSPSILEFSNFDRRGFKNGLMAVIFNDKLTYIDTSEKVIWKQKSALDKKDHLLDIDRVIYSNKLVYRPFPIKAKNTKFKNVELKDSILVTAEIPVNFSYRKGIKGLNLTIENTTGKDIRFYKKIRFVYQALDADSNWVNIVEEIVYDFQCGTFLNYAPIESGVLPAYKSWNFSFPVFTGGVKTKMRIGVCSPHVNGSEYIYSQPFEGCINPGQLYNIKNENNRLVDKHLMKMLFQD